MLENRRLWRKTERGRLRQYRRRLAPGTLLRAGLGRILHSHTGALVVLGDNPKVQQVFTGGFRLDAEPTSQTLREPTELDGAIVLSNNFSCIVAADVHFVLVGSLPIAETGTRHRSADRTMQASGVPVMTASASMSTISLFMNGDWYVVETSGQMISHANQTLTTLSRFVNRLDSILHQFNALEVSEQVTIRDLVLVAQHFEVTRRLSAEAQFHIDTLGVGGHPIVLQHAELVDEFTGLDEQSRTDYAHNLVDPSLFTLEPLHNLSAEGLLSSQLVAERIGFDESPYLEAPIHTRGARLLTPVGYLSESMTTKLTNRFSLWELFSVSVSEFQQLERTGSTRARLIRNVLLHIIKAAYTRPQTPV